MIKFPKTRIQRLAIAGAICLISTPVLWGGNGKGQGSGGGKEDPPLPDIAYRLTWLGTLGGAESIARDISDLGVVVGDATNGDGDWRAFRVVPEKTPNGKLKYWRDGDNDGMNDLMQDINVINGIPTTWVDSENPGVPATGWVAWRAYGINTWGEIVGLAWHPATDETRAFLFSDLPDHPSPRFLLLPRIGPGRPRARAINDHGTIVGILWEPGVRTDAIVYSWNASSGQYEGNELLHPDTGNPIAVDLGGRGININNNGQMIIAASDSLGYRAIRLTPNDEGGYTMEEDFPGGLRPQAINESGTFVGQEWIRKGNMSIDDASFRYSNANGLEILTESRRRDGASDINSSGDVCLNSLYSAYLLWENDPSISEDNVLVALDDLVIGTSEDLNLWNDVHVNPGVSAINMRDGTGFAQICGQADLGDITEPFVLTPETR